MKKCLAALAFCVLLCVSASAQVTFEAIQSPIGPTWGNFALSKNGQVMAANFGGEIYRWTAQDGFVDLGLGDIFNSSIGISADGSTIVGGRTGADGNSSPAMWQSATGWVDLGHPAEGCSLDNSWGDSWGVSGHGLIVVGLAWYCPGAEGFEWTKANGIVGLGHPPGASSRATNISADGTTIVGFYEDPTQGFRRPVRWIAGTTDIFLGDLPGEAIAVTSDGSKIVGQVTDSTGIGRPYIYTNADGVVSLGTMSKNGIDEGVANGVSDRGVVVGTEINPFYFTTRGFIWSAQTGIQSMKTFLLRNGAKMPTGLTITGTLAISADGSTIIGTWQDANFHSGSWVARLQGKALLK